MIQFYMEPWWFFLFFSPFCFRQILFGFRHLSLRPQTSAAEGELCCQCLGFWTRSNQILPWSSWYSKQIPEFSSSDYRHFPHTPKHRQHLSIWKTKYLMVSLFQWHWLPAWKTKNNLWNSLGKWLWINSQTHIEASERIRAQLTW